MQTLSRLIFLTHSLSSIIPQAKVDSGSTFKNLNSMISTYLLCLQLLSCSSLYPGQACLTYFLAFIHPCTLPAVLFPHLIFICAILPAFVSSVPLFSKRPLLILTIRSKHIYISKFISVMWAHIYCCYHFISLFSSFDIKPKCRHFKIKSVCLKRL